MERQDSRVLDCDVLVIGSGAPGLTAAVTAAEFGLKVIVAEKAAVFGGTSAWSGGWLWIPRNPLAQEAGIDEPPEDPMRYLQSELGNRAGDPRLPVFLEMGPRMVRFLRDRAGMRWIDGNRIPDFHETPGAGKGGRSVSVEPFDGRALGPWIKKLRPLLEVVSLWGAGIGPAADMRQFFDKTRRPRAAAYVARRVLAIWRDRLIHGRPLRLANGNALVARLMRAALDRGVMLIDSAPAVGLVSQAGRRTEDGIEIDFPISRQDIAEMTGTTLHTVSRLLSAWEEEGIVRSGRQKVTVTDPHALMLLAENRRRK